MNENIIIQNTLKKINYMLSINFIKTKKSITFDGFNLFNQII